MSKKSNSNKYYVNKKKYTIARSNQNISRDNEDNEDNKDYQENITNQIDNNQEEIVEQIQKNSVREHDDNISLKKLGEDVQQDDENEKVYGYPKPDDPNLQLKIYKKREFYYYKLPDRPDLSNYKSIEEYRKRICEPTGQLLEHQSLLSNFINPDTPYDGLFK
jgi:hypothetical protein